MIQFMNVATNLVKFRHIIKCAPQKVKSQPMKRKKRRKRRFVAKIGISPYRKQ